jgi:SAM-dependent methyltransferase
MAVERLDIDRADGPWAAEHLARYHFAASVCRGKIVLDIACGTGYGSRFLLQQGAAKVLPADIDPAALELTLLQLTDFPPDKVEPVRVSEDAIPLQDDAVDVIVCMETIEHVKNDKNFVKELNRVLKPGGLLLMSTPNALVTNPKGGKPDNPFHLREYTPIDLKELLIPFFEIKDALGQGLPPAYGPAPFLPGGTVRYSGLSGRLSALLWKLLLRLPPLRDPLFKAIRGFHFYPEAKDYLFSPECLNTAHVQMLKCAPLK